MRAEEQSGLRALSPDTPRREAVKTLGVAGAALLGALALQAAAADVKAQEKAKGKGKGKKAKSEKKKSKVGPPGPAGSTGPQGPQGPAGASGQGGNVSFVLGTFETFSVPANDFNSTFSQCPQGAIAISGSYLMTNPKCTPTSSNQPSSDTWEVSISCPAGEASADNVLQAICLRGLG